MIKLSMIFSILFGMNLALANYSVKPGLWEYSVAGNVNGQNINIQEQMKTAMANLTPEQRKKVQEMMGGSGANLSNGKMQVCLTKEMISENQMYPQPNSTGGSKKDDNCDFKTKKKTSRTFSGSFTCKDGSRGDVDWTMTSNTSYRGTVNSITDGNRSTMNYTAKYISSNCK